MSHTAFVTKKVKLEVIKMP